MTLFKSLCAAALLVPVVSFAQNAEFTNPQSIHKPFGYTHVVSVPANQKMVFISGQLGISQEGKLVGKPGDFKAQAQQAFQNLDTALKAVGAKWEHVVKINMYLTDVKTQLPLLRDVRDSFVNTQNPPASTTVQIPRLVTDGALFEIDATVIMPESK
ncbi:Enamine deaminase RidA, house cleaning of reactive enamine intermediates, YjgF/YER057c/UK114 family [Pasteurella testudinis DSM 23072]|uniref:Enamine deaminase RidA, house cleaning of reactive enamine intermediates, YjgF/YER057c/UK114 family n=1 Tax=Pasteurella testudinis DSM 23072 TaxID=1122938 RepID=A0A1W1V6Q9_9PAST|nr:RidA family protein [Pasteurella testudinis]SMB89097.1 Enamine deaminase RidA, house cleaning of reactive enamine intermediates, YjgF/YER057c/UK114 family [Pasteurella testudinis DSM 23072]SUB50203.1 Enamine/imine deaminase [Pasteurella testudinis]